MTMKTRKSSAAEPFHNPHLSANVVCTITVAAIINILTSLTTMQVLLTVFLIILPMSSNFTVITDTSYREKKKSNATFYYRISSKSDRVTLTHHI